MEEPKRRFAAIAEGVEMCVLRRSSDGAMTFLIRMAKGARAPHHDHPGGEETYIVEGRLRIANRADADGRPCPDLVLSAGEYGYAPPGETHDGVAEEAALFFVVAPRGSVIIRNVAVLT